MIETSRGHSFVVYSYDGGPLSFVLPFTYLEQSHVRAYLGEGETATPIAFTWVSSNTIAIADVSTGAPYSVTLRRVTPIDLPLVDFQDGARLPADDLNRATLQLLFLLQERNDYGDSSNSAPSELPGGSTPAWSVEYLAQQVLGSPVFSGFLDAYEDSNATTEVLLAELARSIEAMAQARLTSAQTNDSIEKANELILAEIARAEILLDGKRFLNGRVVAAETSLTTLVGENTARAQEITQLAAALSDEENDRIASYGALNTAMVTADQAIATSVTSLDAEVNDNKVSIDQRFVALAQGTTDPDGAWTALYSLQIVGQTAGGDPVVAGFGLGVSPTGGSDFVVAADRFSIVHPSYLTGDAVPKVPFIVGTVNGVSTVGINGTLAVDGSITANKLSVTSLSALTANAGTLNGGTFKTHTLDVNGDIINPTEFRCEMTNIGSYPLWIGTGAKTEGNAVFYIKNDGSAKFAGDVSAPNVLGNLQVSLNLYSTSSTPVTGPTNYTTVYSFTLPAPIRPGEAHSPAVTLTVLMATFRQAIVVLEYLNGSVWTECSKADAGDVTGSADAFIYSNALTLSGSLPPTTTAVDFRIRVTHNQSLTTNVTGIRGFAFGIR